VGSIGERHIHNLFALGIRDVILYRTIGRPFRTLDRELPTFTNLGDALRQNPDLVLVCNPTSMHLEIVRKCLEHGCDVFVEKPISNNMDQVAEIVELAIQRERILQVGFMMRFHPCLVEIRRWINEGLIGRLISIRSVWGEFLPDWHPWEDYRESYAARVDLGGGPALTLSHDIDVVVWLAGRAKKLIAIENRSSDLEVETEHGIDVLIEFQNSITANINLNYYQKPPKRQLEICGTEGFIHFDYYLGRSVLNWDLSTENEIATVPPGFERNDLFMWELQDFIARAERKDYSERAMLYDAVESLRIAVAALNFAQHSQFQN